MDVLLAVNFTADYFLLRLTAKFMRMEADGKRLLLAGTVGAGISLGIFLPQSLRWAALLAEILSGAAMLRIAYGRQQKKKGLKIAVTFFGISCLYTGVVTVLWYYVAPKGLLIRNGIVYYDCSPVLLMGLLIISYTLLRMIERLGEYRNNRPPEQRLWGQTDEGGCWLTGIIDTGNCLTEAYSELPVVLLSERASEKLFPRDLLSAMQGENTALFEKYPYWKTKVRMIPYSSVGGNGVLPAFRGKLALKKGTPKEIFRDVYFAVSNIPQAAEGWEVIFPPDL